MDPDQGKLFVGGISWETSEDTLSEHFNKYGDVVDSVIMRDRNTGSARGFGFVLFSDPSAADKALQDKEHVILGRTVEVKRAVPRGDQHHNQNQHHNPNQQHNKGYSKNSSNGGSNNNQSKTKKIFVGGLSASLTEEEFKSYFEKFGRITDVVVMYDGATHRPRGFGFITFDSEEAVENVMQKNFHELNDKLVEVKRAVPKDGSSNGNRNNSYNGGGSSGRGYPVGGVYPPYSPRYGAFPNYLPPPLSGYGGVGGYPYGGNFYGGGYPIGGYGGGYGATPIGAPRSPWNGVGMVGARRSPLPYNNAAMYPSFVNGGLVGGMGMTAGGYHGFVGVPTNGKWNEFGGGPAQIPSVSTLPQVDDDGSGLGGSYGAATGKNNQRGDEEQFRPQPVDTSN